MSEIKVPQNLIKNDRKSGQNFSQSTDRDSRSHQMLTRVSELLVKGPENEVNPRAQPMIRSSERLAAPEQEARVEDLSKNKGNHDLVLEKE